MTYKHDSDVLQKVRAVKTVRPILPAAHHMDTRLLMLDGQVHVMPGDGYRVKVYYVIDHFDVDAFRLHRMVYQTQILKSNSGH
jgi:hypothetical protein